MCNIRQDSFIVRDCERNQKIAPFCAGRSCFSGIIFGFVKVISYANITHAFCAAVLCGVGSADFRRFCLVTFSSIPIEQP